MAWCASTCLSTATLDWFLLSRFLPKKAQTHLPDGAPFCGAILSVLKELVLLLFTFLYHFSLDFRCDAKTRKVYGCFSKSSKEELKALLPAHPKPFSAQLRYRGR